MPRKKKVLTVDERVEKIMELVGSLATDAKSLGQLMEMARGVSKDKKQIPFRKEASDEGGAQADTGKDNSKEVF